MTHMTERPGSTPAGFPAATLKRLRQVRGFVFDLDGTLVLGDRHNQGLVPLPGAIEIIEWARRRRVPFVVFTNGTTKTPRELAAVLRGIGFDVPDDAVLTPASSAVSVLVRRGHRRVLVLGGDGLAGPLQAAGLEVVPAAGDGRPGAGDGRPGAGGGPPGSGDGRPEADAVLAGWYPEFTLAALEAACHAVWNGAALYSCSQSMFFATAHGRAIGTSRAMSAMIRDLTGCRVNLVGKPSLDALRTAAARLGLRSRELAVVGDDPELEVPMAHRGRALAVAVASGLAVADSFDHLPPERRPHLHLRGVDELLSLCQEEEPR
ncbi:MAG TPA: HAD hydrolase-like protein [Streptosporangiaceae bacterium]|nr:HAD hydrolase-like protein [Streptosporangiaceae bacterium]